MMKPLPRKNDKSFILFCGVLSMWLVMHALFLQSTSNETVCEVNHPKTNSSLFPSPERIDPQIGEHVTGVLVETMKKAGLQLVMQQFFLNMGPSADLVVWHSKENKDFFEGIIHNRYDFTSNYEQIQLLKKWSNANSTLLADRFREGKIKFHEFEEEEFAISLDVHVYNGRHWHNQIFMSDKFWMHLNSSTFALTMQPDTILCRPLTSDYLNHTYIGGLSDFKNKDYPDDDPYENRRRHRTLKRSKESKRRKDQKRLRIGTPRPEHVEVKKNPTPNSFVKVFMNGGLSLRHVEWTRECIERIGKTRNWMEDGYFNFCHQWMDSSKPTLETSAYGFSSDNGFSMCHDVPSEQPSEGNARVCPLGVHKPWAQKGTKCQDYQELVNYCPEIARLEKLQFTFD